MHVMSLLVCMCICLQCLLMYVCATPEYLGRTYTVYTIVCGQKYAHLQIGGFGYFSTPVADRCIKSSTQPCNLHRQTMTVELPTEELSDFQCGTVIGCHLSNESVRQISALLELLELPGSTVRATTCQPWSGRPHKLKEWNRWSA
jgi:hypothetical protein